MDWYEKTLNTFRESTEKGADVKKAGEEFVHSIENMVTSLSEEQWEKLYQFWKNRKPFDTLNKIENISYVKEALKDESEETILVVAYFLTEPNKEKLGKLMAINWDEVNKLKITTDDNSDYFELEKRINDKIEAMLI